MKYLFIAIVVIVVGLTIFIGVGGEDYSLYIEETEQLRSRKDRNFKSTEDSPLLPEDKDSFQGLDYYEVKPEFRITARLVKNQSMERLVLGSSTGEYLTYIKYGYAEFELDGKEQKLLLLQSTGRDSSNQLFLPFSDETSAVETYGGGRYLDLDYDPSSKKIILDFNKAYSPYCAYNENYSCAIPPPENHMMVAIPAGEKNYTKK